MARKRQKMVQLRLALPEEGRGEAPRATEEGTELAVAEQATESPAKLERVMEEVLRRENLVEAWKRVTSNGGSPGIDGMQVAELMDYMRETWATIRGQLEQGTYKPQPVKRVEIPKPSGGKRRLGIPTVLDRFIQQAVMQVLQKEWDPTFSEHSYGFRPGRSAASS